MLMAEDDGLKFWASDGDVWLGGEEKDDDVWIDWDELNGMLSDDCGNQNLTQEQENRPEDLSCNNSWHGGVVPSEVTHCSQSELQNGIRDSDSVPQREDVILESSGWSCSENIVLSDSRSGMEAGQMIGFSETSGMIFDHQKVNSVSHINSSLCTCSLSPTDRSTMSCIEHDTCSSRARDAGATVPSYDYDGNIIHEPNCSTAFNIVSGNSSGCIDNVNFNDMKSENEYDLTRAEDSHSKCASHLTAMEESGIAFGSPSAVYGNSMEDPGAFEGNFQTSDADLFFMDVESSLPNPYPTEIDLNQVYPMSCETGRIHIEQSCYDGSSTIADYTNAHNFLPHYVGLPFTESKEGSVGCTEAEVGNQILLSQSTCTNSKFNLDAQESISGKPVNRNASAINFSNTSMKYEASPHCSLTGMDSSGEADGTSSSDSSRKPINGCHSFMQMNKEMICIEDDQRDEFSEFNSSSYRSLKAVHKAVEGYGSFSRSSRCLEDGHWTDEVSNQLMPHTQSIISTKNRDVLVKNEIKNEFYTHSNMNSHHVKVNGVPKGNNSFHRSAVDDDDADICILEDISVPRNTPPMRSQGEPLVTSLRPVNNNLYHIGLGGTRLKAIDERITYHVALQDLSQPKTESTPPEGVLAVPLLRHQRIALAWMVQKETASVHCSGGILADDQGLGKTISTIALILSEKPTTKASSVAVKQNEPKAFNLDDEDDGGFLHLRGLNEDNDSGQNAVNKNQPNDDSSFKLLKGRPAAGTLVVCPTSVLRQWADELQNKVSADAKVSVLVYHGSNRTKDPTELAKYDVVLTTYSIVSMEVPKQPLVDKDDDEKGSDDLSSLEFSSKKRKYPPNGDKKSRKNKKGIDAAMLESITRPLARVGWFRVVLDEAQSIKNHRTQVARACWGLRAKRRWCLSGTPVQNAIDDLYSYFRFLRYDPYAAYKSFCSMIKVPISRNPTNGYKKLQAVLKTIMLRRTKGTLLDGEPIINLPPKSIELKRVDFSEEERDFYSKLEADSQAQFRVYAEAGTVKQNYVNILLMLLRLRQACDHPLLVKGYDSSSVWRSSLETAKKLAREKQAQLLNCLEACSEICGICNDPPEDAVVTICGHIFCNQCILEFLTGDENICPAAQCKVHLSITSVFSRETLKNSLFDQLKHDGAVSLPIDAFEPCSQIPTDSSKIKAALKVLESLSKPGVSSSKDAVDSSQVRNHVMNDSRVKVSEKAIVFSQWTRMLDLLEAHLKDSSIQYRRLDGTMSVLARDKAVKDFNTIPEVTVMIMSLKAASLGLNMVAACHVILLDLWWNPTTEDQAIDRAHRIGQTRPVTVLRLTVKDTVEDRILALQQKKREMVASAFGEDETGSRQSRLTVDDLKYLFMA